MINTAERKAICYLCAAFSFGMLLMLLIPIAQGIVALRQSDQLLQQGRLLQAAQLRLRASKGLFWQSEDLIEQAGKIFLQAQQAQLSIESLRPLYVRHRLSYAGKLILAQAYAQAGYVTMANQLRQELADSGYLPLILYPLLLESFQSTHQFLEASETLGKLIMLQSHFPFWRYRYGLILLTAQPEEAKKILKEIVANDVTYKDGIEKLLDPLERSQSEDMGYQLLQAGRGLASIGEWTLAEEAFYRAVSIRPDYAEAWAYLGLAKFRNAFSVLTPNNLPNTEKTSLIPDESADHPKGWLRDRSGLAEIRHALWLKPQSQVALVFETQYWLERGYPQIAIKSATKAVKIYPKDEAVLENYAQVLAQNGALESAWQVFHEIFQITDQKTEAAKSLLRFDIQNEYQLWEEALPLARTLTYQNPGDVESLDLLAQVLFSLNYLERATEILAQALRLDPNYAPAHLHLGIIYLQNNRINDAIRELNYVIQIAPNTPIAYQAQRILVNYLP